MYSPECTGSLLLGLLISASVSAASIGEISLNCCFDLKFSIPIW